MLILADTHLRPDGLDRLPAEIWTRADEADAVLHAGDVVCPELLEALAERAPVFAVLGNNDIGRVDHLPERLETPFAGVAVAMVHDSGPRKGRENRMNRWFPNADLVIFGHSHEPVDLVTEHGQRLFNPGSPTTRRRQPACSYGWATLDEGRIAIELVMLDP